MAKTKDDRGHDKAARRYKARPGSRITDKDATVLGPIFDRLRSANGGALCSEHVVTEATKRGSPLRRHFTWDPEQAAHERRLDQARQLIASVEVIIVRSHAEPVVVRQMSAVIHRLPDEPPRHMHVSIEQVSESDEFQRQIRDRLLRQIVGLRHSYAKYQELFPAVFDAIDKAIREMESA